jgi:cell division protein FtsI/penicillin-binding protein 2
VSGKTGTAEIDIKGVRHKNTWFLAYAPSDAPTVALVILVEDGESGGKTVAPLAREVLVSIFGESTNEPPTRVEALSVTGGD